MLIVYFGDKIITFSKTDNGNAENKGIWVKNERFGITKMLEKLENNNSLTVISEDPEVAFKEFCSEFEEVGAAGGLVRNSKGEVLMIYRNGRWDLPKGHIEEKEYPEECSVREVEEETGIGNIHRGRLITVTYHFYYMHDRWEMKETYWYEMTSDDGHVFPQEEEGITKVEWVAVEKLGKYVETCFPSVRSVFIKAGLV